MLMIKYHANKTKKCNTQLDLVFEYVKLSSFQLGH